MEPTAQTRAARVSNLDELCSHGITALRQDALAIANVGLTACDGARATSTAVAPTADGISICGREYRLEPGARVFVLGAGKATLPIATSLEETLGDRIAGGVVILRRGEAGRLSRIETLIADHPLPSEASVEGARRLVELADAVGPRDLVIACLTGGSSALACLPAEGVSFEEKRDLHEMLLGSGMPIAEVNSVRKHVSLIKGGRLAERIAPARIVNLTVSDVAGDQLDVITDPTVPDTSTVAEAISVLEDYELWDRLPPSIASHLTSPGASSPDLASVEVTTELLVTGFGVCEAMVGETRKRGYEPVILTTTLEGEAREMGRFIADIALSSSTGSYPFKPGTVLLGCGGESSVAIAGKGEFGDGGPGQEAAIAAALELDGSPVVVLFMDTDGSDGGTDAAGAIADGESARRASEAGLDLRKALMRHGAMEPLEALGDLLLTGATGTNVNDLFVAVVGEPAT